MKVVALLSGGKDSIYNVMKCVEYGHDIVCIGNLRPAPKDIDELDSEMYQTVGWNGIEFIAKAMDLPFYFKTTLGKSKQHSVSYNHFNIDNENKNENKMDEVEDLFNLLLEIKKKHPEITGVASGAILSNYQRTRIESVCERLNLVNLSYLWQRTDQNILLKEMISNKIDAIIIKCASMGLLPNEFINKSIQDTIIYNKLTELGELYGMNVCGEGGEYETFVIDCPLFKQFKISIDESSICGNIKDPICPTGYLKFIKLSLVCKQEQQQNINIHNAEKEKEDKNNNDYEEEKDDWKLLKIDHFKPFYEPQLIKTTNVCNYGLKNGIFQFVSHPNVSINNKYISDLDLKTEMNLLFNALTIKLKEYDLNICHLFYCHLFVNDMSLFAKINTFYKSYFTNSLYPPSRVCCELDFSHKHKISLEALGYKYKTQKQNEINKNVFDCLHVQSISEWAPNCIGPYSQASKIANKFIFAAGVIGLEPATMKMIENNKPKKQIDLTWKNMNAVLTSFDSNLSLVIHHNIFVLAGPKTKTDECEEEKSESITLSKEMDPYLFGIVQRSVFKHIITDLDFNAVVIYVPDLPKHALIELQTLSLTQHCVNTLNESKCKPYSMTNVPAQHVHNIDNNDNDAIKRKVKLKYAHIKRKKKHNDVRKVDIYAICKEYKQDYIGNFLSVKTKTIYNLYDKWCSLVSICELTTQQNANTISTLIKSALSQSILYLNGYGFILQKQNMNSNDNKTTIWTERSIVFLRLYYNSEALEPKSLLHKIESCFQDLSLSKIPAISLIPCRGVCFVNEKEPNNINHNFGVYMLHCFLYEQ